MPLAVLIGLAGYDLSLKTATRTEMAKLGALTAGIAGISRLVHELQRELGVSAVFIGSKGSQFRGELPKQRERTDAARGDAAGLLAELRGGAVSAEFIDVIAAADGALARLDAQRRDIEALKVSTADADLFFGGAPTLFKGYFRNFSQLLSSAKHWSWVILKAWRLGA